MPPPQLYLHVPLLVKLSHILLLVKLSHVPLLVEFPLVPLLVEPFQHSLAYLDLRLAVGDFRLPLYCETPHVSFFFFHSFYLF